MEVEVLSEGMSKEDEERPKQPEAGQSECHALSTSKPFSFVDLNRH